MREFTDKVAVITGAASGIGRALADRCAQDGMKIVLADIEKPALRRACEELEATGTDVLGVVTDVSKSADVEHLAAETLRAFGAVHLLVNNAGIALGDKWAWQYTQADWQWIIGVNLWGVVYGIRAFLPVMLERGDEGHIVNTASLAGLCTTSGSGPYAVTKFAVVALSEVLYHELSQIGARVGVSVLCPAGVVTRIGEAERNRPASLPATERAAGSRPTDNELDEKGWRKIWEEALRPDQVADIVFDAVRDERFYIITHPEYDVAVEARMKDILLRKTPSNLWEVLLAQ